MEASARVAYVVGRYPALSESFIRTELSGLPAHGWSPDICALERGDPTDLVPDAPAGAAVRYALPRPLALCSSLLYGIGGSARDRVRGASAARFGESLSTRIPEHVHAHFLGAPTQVGSALAAVLGTSFTFSCHAADVHLAGPTTAAEHEAVHRAFAILACTEHLRRILIDKRGYPARRVRVVRHGVDIAALDAAAGGAERATKPLILAVGRLVPKKGLATLLEAARPLLTELKGELRIIGDGPLRGDLEAKARELDLGDRVRFVGALRWSETVRQMASCSLLAVPSIEAPDGDLDGLPNVALEAAALGVPLVASRIAGLPELLTDDKLGWLVAPGKVAAWTKALRAALTQSEEARRRAERLKAAVRAEWSADRLVGAVGAAFAEAREAHRASGAEEARR